MFILNQNHNGLINLNRIEEIYTYQHFLPSGETKYCIEYSDSNILGCYKSEEKVQKIFEDICIWVHNYEKMKYSEFDIYSTPIIYKMPLDDELENK